MTRQEVLKLLESVSASYPNVKITDAKNMVSVWEGAFANYDAQDVYKAVVMHMTNNKWFPTVAEVNKNLEKVTMLFSDIPAPKIEASKDPYFEEELDWFMNEFREGGFLGYDL